MAASNSLSSSSSLKPSSSSSSNRPTSLPGPGNFREPIHATLIQSKEGCVVCCLPVAAWATLPWCQCKACKCKGCRRNVARHCFEFVLPVVRAIGTTGTVKAVKEASERVEERDTENKPAAIPVQT